MPMNVVLCMYPLVRLLAYQVTNTLYLKQTAPLKQKQSKKEQQQQRRKL